MLLLVRFLAVISLVSGTTQPDITIRYDGTNATVTTAYTDELSLSNRPYFVPRKMLQLQEGATAAVGLNVSVDIDETFGSNWNTLAIDSEQRDVATVTFFDGSRNITRTKLQDLVNSFISSQDSNSTELKLFNISGHFLGYSCIEFKTDSSNQTYCYTLTVVRKVRPVDVIFQNAIYVSIVIAGIGLGCTIELGRVKEVIKKPVGPIIGFLCQYVMMPLIAYALCKIIKLRALLAVGVFAMGCAPGAGASNFYSFLLGGDVSLSITMTLVSNLAAFGMYPLWLSVEVSQKPEFLDQAKELEAEIPYYLLVTTLFSILLPTAVGVLIRWKKENWAKKILWFMKPFYVVMLLFMCTIGIYANLYIFRMFTPELMLAGALLPYIGFVLSGLIALIAKQEWKHVKTIAIEAGMQNVGIPIVMMKFSLEAPLNDMSIVAPICSACLTPLPLMLAILIRFTYIAIKKRMARNSSFENTDDEIMEKRNNNERKMISLKGANEDENDELMAKDT